MKFLDMLLCRSELITVVDERTYHQATRRVAELIEEGDYAKANAGLHAMRLWLRYEVRTGAKRKRAGRAARLEQAELLQAQVREAMGIGGIPGLGSL